jgi:hypothetical protein
MSLRNRQDGEKRLLKKDLRTHQQMCSPFLKDLCVKIVSSPPAAPDRLILARPKPLTAETIRASNTRKDVKLLFILI